MTPTGEAPATSELALAYNGANYKLRLRIFNTVNTATSGPAMWIATSNTNMVLGQGVTSSSPSSPGIGVGFRAARIQYGVTQQASDYLIILPSNPGLFNNNNNSLGNLQGIAGITSGVD